MAHLKIALHDYATKQKDFHMQLGVWITSWTKITLQGQKHTKVSQFWQIGIFFQSYFVM